MDDPAIGHVVRVPVHGYEVATYSFGSGDEVLLLLHGGPGMSCDYLWDPHTRLARDGLRVVGYDQLGCGDSDRPDDNSLWTLQRHVEELEIVRTTLGLGRLHLLGQSWGAMLAVEYALAHPEGIKTLILTDGAASIPHLARETDRLRDALGSETVAMLQRHEAEGSVDHPEYKGAMEVLNFRHFCRLQQPPAPLQRSIEQFNPAPYTALVGINDWCCTGSLKDWDRLPDMHRIIQPALVICGLHDVLTPACSRLMHNELPDSRIVVLPNSSHTPFFEEPDGYFAAVEPFIRAHMG